MVAGGWGVSILDDLSTGSLDNISSLAGRVRFVGGSILDAGLVEGLVERCDLVVHLAAAVGVRYILDHPLETIRTNVDGARTVLEACARFHRKVLVASTSEVYGKNTADALCETADSVLGPAVVSRWSYATSKKLDEFLALAYVQSCGLPAIVTRFFNIVGPRQAGRYGMVLPNFIRAALAGEPIRVFGDGRQTRNFTFVGDCVEALIRLLLARQAEGEVFNIGGNHEISILELARLVKRITRSGSPIVHVPYEKAYPEGGFEDMQRRVPCICKIQRLVGWAPETSIEEMVTRTVVEVEQRVPAPLLAYAPQLAAVG